MLLLCCIQPTCSRSLFLVTRKDPYHESGQPLHRICEAWSPPATFPLLRHSCVEVSRTAGTSGEAQHKMSRLRG
jgi:hypothetical protein